MNWLHGGESEKETEGKEEEKKKRKWMEKNKSSRSHKKFAHDNLSHQKLL